MGLREGGGAAGPVPNCLVVSLGLAGCSSKGASSGPSPLRKRSTSSRGSGASARNVPSPMQLESAISSGSVGRENPRRRRSRSPRTPVVRTSVEPSLSGCTAGESLTRATSVEGSVGTPASSVHASHPTTVASSPPRLSLDGMQSRSSRGTRKKSRSARTPRTPRGTGSTPRHRRPSGAVPARAPSSPMLAPPVVGASNPSFPASPIAPSPMLEYRRERSSPSLLSWKSASDGMYSSSIPAFPGAFHANRSNPYDGMSGTARRNGQLKRRARQRELASAVKQSVGQELLDAMDTSVHMTYEPIGVPSTSSQRESPRMPASQDYGVIVLPEPEEAMYDSMQMLESDPLVDTSPSSVRRGSLPADRPAGLRRGSATPPTVRQRSSLATTGSVGASSRRHSVSSVGTVRVGSSPFATRRRKASGTDPRHRRLQGQYGTIGKNAFGGSPPTLGRRQGGATSDYGTLPTQQLSHTGVSVSGKTHYDGMPQGTPDSPLALQRETSTSGSMLMTPEVSPACRALVAKLAAEQVALVGGIAEAPIEYADQEVQDRVEDAIRSVWTLWSQELVSLCPEAADAATCQRVLAEGSLVHQRVCKDVCSAVQAELTAESLSSACCTALALCLDAEYGACAAMAANGVLEVVLLNVVRTVTPVLMQALCAELATDD